MSNVEREAGGNRAGIAFQVLAAVEAGLTPFIQACLSRIHGTTDFVNGENTRRRVLKKKGGKVPSLLKSGASSSPHWDYADILKTFSSLWPQFDSQMSEMIALRNRGVGHRNLGPFTDHDLSHLCKYAEQLLRVTGVAHEADVVHAIVARNPEAASSYSSVLPTCLPENCHSVEEFLDKAGNVAGMLKPVSTQVPETETRERKTLRVGSKTLTLRPHTETASLRQSFSHGRSKQQVVEKRGIRRVVETESTKNKPLSRSSKLLTLRPHTETGTLRQSFPHGRAKQVVEKRGKSRFPGTDRIETAAGPAEIPNVQQKQTDSGDKSG